MDVAWIRRFVAAKGDVRSWDGRVFLEVHLPEGWALLDATNLVLYRDYATSTRILPGNRYAYDKGGDPYAMILSPNWQAWKAQTAAYFGHFDVSTLPVGDGEALQTLGISDRLRKLRGPAFVAANAPFWARLTDRLGAAGIHEVTSFNMDFDEHLKPAAGHTLIVAFLTGAPVLPNRYWPGETEITLELLKQRESESPSGIFERKRGDGTEVIVLYAKDEAELAHVIDTF